MLHIVWGDDEHTSIDGPYARLMKARKWIYILSLIGLIIEFGLYNEAATEALVRVVDVPASLIRALVVLGLTYLMAQYAMLAVQLGTACGPTVGLLVLRCAAGGREAIVAWPGAFFSARGARVSWRVDESEIREESWMNIPGLTTGARTGSPNRLLDAIETGQQLVMRVESYSTVQDIVFDLGDGAAAVQAIREACP